MTYREFKDRQRLELIEYWTDMLAAHHGNVAKTALAAGTDRTWLFDRIKSLGIERPERLAIVRPKRPNTSNRGNAEWQALGH